MSARASTRWFRTCSGATYSARATIDPCRVSPPPAAACLASPKSLRYTWSPRASRTLEGLTSRCSIPRAWAASSAAPTWRTMRAARSGSMRPSAAITARMSVPSTRRIMMKSTPSSSPASKMGITFGWSIAAAILRLAPKALAEAFLPGVLGEDQLEGHRALERELLGPVDDAHVSVADHLLDAAPREHGAQRELGGQLARAASGAAAAGGLAAAAGGFCAAGGEPGRGRRRRCRRGGRLRGSGAALGGGGSRRAAAGRAPARGRSTPGSSSRPAPSRRPSAPGGRARARRSRMSRSPTRDPRCSARRSPRGRRGRAGGTARESSLSLPSPLTSAPDDELVPEGEPAAQRRARR